LNKLNNPLRGHNLSSIFTVFISEIKKKKETREIARSSNKLNNPLRGHNFSSSFINLVSETLNLRFP